MFNAIIKFKNMTQISTGTQSYPFCADYSAMATCLFAIQNADTTGAFSGDPGMQELLRVFDQDILRKLYLRTLQILKAMSGGATLFPGDFEPADFSERDFSVEDTDGGQTSIFQNVLEDDPFFDQSFFKSFLDTRNTGYSSRFQTILNIFGEFCKRSSEISDTYKSALNDALVPVLNAFDDLQQYLNTIGLNPCDTTLAYLNNSPSLYLQAAGSDGTKGIPAGIHLRWSLAGDLGSNHLLKGDYDAVSTSGYNQPNDYIQVTRTPYINTVRNFIDFETDKPVIDLATKSWNYIIAQNINNKTIFNRIKLTFTDADLYNQLAVNTDPTTDFFNFLAQYTSLILLEVLNKALFMVGFDFRKDAVTGTATLKIETESIIENTGDASAGVINTRKTVILDTASISEESIYAENIWKISLKKSVTGYLQRFSFETYHDFLSTCNQSDWSPVGDPGFSLSLVDQQVFDRLETSAYPVDHLWPQFNEGTTVRVANYRDKWTTTRPNEPSIKDIVRKYLALSETDPRAEDILKDENADPGDPGMVVSYLDVLHMLAIDYHIARMLGLGCIDIPVGATVTDKFFYQINYTNRKSIDSVQRVNYSYTSLPISKMDQLTPEKPAIRPITYSPPAGDLASNSGFDDQGYLKTDHIRFINISRGPFIDEIPDYDFFADMSVIDNYNIFETPKPVLYGIEYRPANQSTYIKPEITAGPSTMGTIYHAYDSAYPETGVPETVPVPDNVTSLYHHFERQEGIHFYAIYGISWLARASALSDETATDATHFAQKNRLLPPADVAVQFIQKEDILLFTSAIEQAWYQGRSDAFPGQDISFTRVTFNWMDIIDISQLQGYSVPELTTVVRPDKIKAYFGLQLPLEITGLIQYILPVSGSDIQLSLLTAGYTQIDGTVINPVINPVDFSRFTDSLLTTTAGQFRVIRIDPGANGPIITIEKTTNHQNVESDEQSNYYGLQTFYSGPEINSRFSMVENLNNTANWKPINADISLTSLADINNPLIESSTDTEGNVTKNWIGGINGNALVTPLFGNTNDPSDLPGYYKIEFETGVILNPNPQINLPFNPEHPGQNPPGQLNGAHVEWYKGNVRIPLASGDVDKKILEVMRIDQTSPLVLYVYDAGYQDNPITSSTSPTTTVVVNFHPGYRAYLFDEPAPVNAFNENNILPVGTENSRKTLIGLQTADTRTGGSGFRSGVSIPAVLLARKVEDPVQIETLITAQSNAAPPATFSLKKVSKTAARAKTTAALAEAPSILGLKIRPDATAKAAFTFDIRIPASRNPFGFLFCRVTQEDVLGALYESTTINQIENRLTDPDTDVYYCQRFFELVNLIFDPENQGQFKVLGTGQYSYGFPAPDKTGLINVGDSVEIKTAKYRAAIQGTFLPLTQQTPIAAFIKEGVQTDNKEPRIRDIFGNLLDPSSPDFDPFPMIRKYSNNSDPGATYIRFTDYSLNASSRSLYFYAGAEVTSQLVRGDLSPFTGPVIILPTLPPEAPLIRTFSIGPSVLPATTPLSVTFQLSPLPPEDQVSIIRIYRTTDLLKAGSLQTMDTHVDIPVIAGLKEGYQVTDALADIQPFPAGETLYYRLAGVRFIINESGSSEEVLSLGSTITVVKIMDTTNPVAPVITYALNPARLSWPVTTNKGTYYLYKQNNSGNWEKIFTSQPEQGINTVLYPFSTPLSLTDEDGNRIYYRFKVKVENASGLLNLTDQELTI